MSFFRSVIIFSSTKSHMFVLRIIVIFILSFETGFSFLLPSDVGFPYLLFISPILGTAWEPSFSSRGKRDSVDESQRRQRSTFKARKYWNYVLWLKTNKSWKQVLWLEWGNLFEHTIFESFWKLPECFAR